MTLLHSTLFCDNFLKSRKCWTNRVFCKTFSQACFFSEIHYTIIPSMLVIKNTYKAMRTLLYGIYCNLPGKNFGLEGQRLVLKLLTGISIYNKQLCFMTKKGTSIIQKKVFWSTKCIFNSVQHINTCWTSIINHWI